MFGIQPRVRLCSGALCVARDHGPWRQILKFSAFEGKNGFRVITLERIIKPIKPWEVELRTIK